MICRHGLHSSYYLHGARSLTKANIIVEQNLILIGLQCTLWDGQIQHLHVYQTLHFFTVGGYVRLCTSIHTRALGFKLVHVSLASGFWVSKNVCTLILPCLETD